MSALRLTGRTLLAAALLCAAGPGSAQLGIDLSDEKPAARKAAEKKKPVEKKKPAAKPKKKAPPPRPAAQPASKPVPEPAPAPPIEAARPPAPAPAPPPSPAEAAPPAPRPAPPIAPRAGFEAVDLAGQGQGKPRLETAKKLLADKDWEGAALAFDALLRDPAAAEVHDEARFRLAVVLARDGLHHAALARFDDVLARGAQGSRFFHNSLEWLFWLGRRTANEAVILSRVARFAGEPAPPAAAEKFNTLLARYSYERGLALSEAGQAAEARKAFDEARRVASLVRGDGTRPPAEVDDLASGDGNLAAQARFLEGLVAYAQGDSQAAVESFKEVVRLTNPRRTRAPDPRLRELAFLQLGRIHYEYQQNRNAIFYYQRMPWGGPSWLEGLWESTYAHYRAGDHEKALGNLLTLQSPYFQDEWFPESYLLKAILYYENCRYPEARAILEDFSAAHEPVLAELERITGRGGPRDLYAHLDASRLAPAGNVARRVFKAAFTDRNIERLDVSVREVRAERQEKLPRTREPFRSSALARDLAGQLEAEERRLAAEGGARSRQKVEEERDGLRDLLQQALRIKIEVSRKERELLEQSLAAGGKNDLVRPYKFSAAVSDEHLFWPYQGEFWRDELGTYAYTLTQGCRDAPAAAGR